VGIQGWALIVVSVIAVLATAVAASAWNRAARASARAKAVTEGRAEIASMVAHEMRGPVSTILGLAATTSAHYDRMSDDQRREFLALIEQDSRRLLSTADQVSLALRIDAGTLTFDFRPAPLAEVIREGVDEADLGDHSIEVDAPDGLSVRCDRRWISQVVCQLVENAAKFSPPDSPILVKASRHADQAMLEVVDAGPGIPADKRRALFAKFPNWRPPGYEQQPGSGLGLFICEALVTEHHGGISIEGAPSGGTMLRIRLPVEG
jgi:two-component system sensor histidine kinase KdpD